MLTEVARLITKTKTVVSIIKWNQLSQNIKTFPKYIKIKINFDTESLVALCQVEVIDGSGQTNVHKLIAWLVRCLFLRLWHFGEI